MRGCIRDRQWSLVVFEIVDDAHDIVERPGQHHVGGPGDVRGNECLRIGEQRIGWICRLDAQDVETPLEKASTPCGAWSGCESVP